MIRIGCSGWSYPEWKGVLYAGRADMFTQYSRSFNTVEINSTFYGLPSHDMVNAWIRKAAILRDFRFSVKMWGEITHKNLLTDTDAASDLLKKFLETVVHPLGRVNLLAACLVQLPPYFRRSDMGRLTSLLSKANTREITYAVEFRDKSLYGHKDTVEELGSMNVSVVSIDSPENPLKEIYRNGPVVYIRLHGRNYETWKTGEGMDRYLYRYSMAELSGIGDLIKSSGITEETLIFFNNHPNGNAPANAMEMMEILGVGGQKGEGQQRLF